MRARRRERRPIVDVRGLQSIAAAADAGNFSRAARSLVLNTSTISRQIARLEDEFGLTLFERSRAGVRLTPGGKSVLPHVRRVLADFDAMAAATQRNGQGEAGEVRLGVRMPPIGEPLVGLLSNWRARHSGLSLHLFELNDREIAAALEERLLDAALIPSFMHWPRTTSLPIWREPIVAALPAAHPAVALDQLKWADLAQETILVQGWDGSQTAREFFASLLGVGAPFQVHAASTQSLLGLVAAGFGITLAAKSQSQASFPGLVFRPIDEENAWLRVDLVWLPETEDPAIGRFMAFMRDAAQSQRLL
jgi:DNA-binding transcriptional LysR family regulator